MIGSDDPAVVVPQVSPQGWVVVATQGRRDVQALRLALGLQARQVSFVASAKKAQVLKDALVAAGADAAAVAAIVAPAGLPVSANTPEEIALSVLAAVVANRRGSMTQGEQAVVEQGVEGPGAAETSEATGPLPTRAGIHAAGTQMGCILKAGGGLYPLLVVGAVLLAAGSGSRLGGRPKPLLELGGVPLIRRQLIALSGAGVDEVVVVLGHHADLIEESMRDFPVTLARNPTPDDGQPSSVRVGLAALSARIDAVIVALADQPMINAQDITALIGAFKKRGDAAMVVPRVAESPATR